MEGNLSQCTVASEACVKDGRRIAGHPASAVVRPRQWIEAHPSRSENLAVERLLRKCIQSVEQVGVVDQLAFVPSKMNAVEKLVQCSEHFIYMTLLNQVSGRPLLQQALARKQPKPRIVRFIDIG